MWETVICPKCGARSEVDPNEVFDLITCSKCLERFSVPVSTKNRIDEYLGDHYLAVGSSPDAKLDSSFWLS